MPHQCVRCSRIYPDGSEELLTGCNCGGKFFFFVKQSAISEAKKITENLTMQDKKRIEKDVMDIIGDSIDTKKPIILDLESIKVLKPGKYEINLVDLFSGKPLVYKIEEGKYIIDVASTFQAKELEVKDNGEKIEIREEDLGQENQEQSEEEKEEADKEQGCQSEKEESEHEQSKSESQEQKEEREDNQEQVY